MARRYRKHSNLSWHLLLVYLILLLVATILFSGGAESECTDPFVVDEVHSSTVENVPVCYQYVDVDCNGEPDLLNVWIAVGDDWVLESSECIAHTADETFEFWKYIPITG